MSHLARKIAAAQSSRTYAVLSAALSSPNIAISGGGLIATSTLVGTRHAICNILPSSGLWYFEVTNEGQVGTTARVGVSTVKPTTTALGNTGVGTAWRYEGAAFYFNSTQNPVAPTITDNQTGGILLNADNRTIQIIAANGVLDPDISTPETGTGPLHIAVLLTQNTDSLGFNFGQNPFVHTVPSGYNAGVYV